MDLEQGKHDRVVNEMESTVSFNLDKSSFVGGGANGPKSLMDISSTISEQFTDQTSTKLELKLNYLEQRLEQERMRREKLQQQVKILARLLLKDKE